ncbi:MAG: hypothetical protein KatS3mg043_2145 [Rhodothermaceae bacterium]|nr:MAG: hypothetical protein KatS3mg043_2145 [Rhodothermaceae bacterium]
MRIVSLLPAATEWVAAFGATEDLVGRSHACDFPPAVRSLPAVTRSRVAEGGDTRAINDAVRATLVAGLSLYEVDLGALRALRPDVVLTQAQCAVCAVDLAGLEALLAGWAGTRPRLFSMAPMTFRAVLQEALHLARLVDRLPQAMAVLGAGERRLRHLRDRLGLPREADPATLPTVACIEWMEPLMTAGHWMPGLVEHAGGRAVLAGAGKPSPVVDWEALRADRPGRDRRHAVRLLARTDPPRPAPAHGTAGLGRPPRRPHRARRPLRRQRLLQPARPPPLPCRRAAGRGPLPGPHPAG